MYTPKSAGEAKPFTLPLKAVREMLYGRYDTDAGRTANREWTNFMNVLGSIHVPENYWDRDPSILASLPEADPQFVGRIGTIWVSENMANLIREVFAVSMMRSIPTLPVSTFWANAEPHWVPQKLATPVRRMGLTVRWSVDRPLDDLTQLSMDFDRVIIDHAQPDMVGADVLIDYESTEAETAARLIGMLVTTQKQQVALAIGDSSSNAMFKLIGQQQRFPALVTAIIEEAVDKEATGIELGWLPTQDEMGLFDQLTAYLRTGLALRKMKLGLAVGLQAGYNPLTLALADWINLSASAVEGGVDLQWLPVDPAKVNIDIECFGTDQRTDTRIGFAAIATEFGLLAPYGNSAANGLVTFKGIDAATATVAAARKARAGGITFVAPELDADTPSLVKACSTAAVAEVGDTEQLTALAYVKGWSIVTGPSKWVDPDQAAIMLIDQFVPYAEGGRAFVDSTLNHLLE